MKKVLLLHPNGLGEVIDLPDDGKLDCFYENIHCDCIDIVEAYALEGLADKHGLESLRGKFCLIVDDEGLLKEKPEVNLIASLLYGADIHGQALFGKAIVAKNEYGEDGVDTVGMDDSELALLQASIGALICDHNEKVNNRE